MALLLGLCLLAGLLVAGAVYPATVGLGLVSNDVGDSVQSVSTDLVDGPLPQTSTMTDAAGNPIARFFDSNQNRQVVTSDQIAPAMKAAIVAIEDRRFYEHNGVDWQGTIRAVVANSTSGSIEQGASTLTQQYVKNYFLYVNAQTDTDRLKATEQTPARKLKEAQIALQTERRLSKEEILARYLNIVSFGNGAAGIASAARTYFNTTANQLTVPQAAMLAGMVRSTEFYNPVTNAEVTLERRNLVIQQMREQQMIDDTQMQAALAAPLGVVDPLVTQPNGCIGAGDAGFFCEYAQKYLADAGFKPEQLARGGYTIKTTLDPGVLAKTRAALIEKVPADLPNVSNNMAIVAPGADKHRVLAMASSRTFGLNKDRFETSFNLPYEPVPFGGGSIYKIFTSATAMEKGLGINYQLEVPADPYFSPLYIDGKTRKPTPVHNAETGLPGRLSLQDALAISPNTAFVKLEEFTGVTDVVDMAVRLGMRALTIPDSTGRTNADKIKADQRASFTLGPEPTSVLDVANVGATLASAGMNCPASPIESITDRAGSALGITEAPCKQAVDPGLANTLMTGLSKDDQPGGTAFGAARAAGWNRPLASKTGTTQQQKAAAFVGIVPQMSGAVITFDNDNKPDTLCDGPGAPYACRSGGIFGGKTPAETWFAAMNRILDGQPVLPLPPTDDRYLAGGAESRVPDVVGSGRNDAGRTLEAAGWKVSNKTEDNAASAGTVIGQSPRGSALPGETIQLTISSGKVKPAPAPPGGGPTDQPPPVDPGNGGGDPNNGNPNNGGGGNGGNG